MIFEFTEIKSIFEVLKILSMRKSKYSEMFKKTRVSHTTLQSVLKKLAQKEFIKKYDLGHQNVNYEITNKGTKLLKILVHLKQIVN